MSADSSGGIASALWLLAARLSHAVGSPMAVGIAYHGVTRDRLEGIDNLYGKHIDARTLEQHLDLIGRNFNVVSLADVVDCIRSGRPLPRRAVFLTFDDGYAGNHDVALPILLKRGFPAAFFVTSALIGTAKRLPLDLLDAAIKATGRESIAIRLSDHTVPLSLAAPQSRCDAALQIRRVYKGLPSPSDSEFLGRIVRDLGFAGPDDIPPLGEHVSMMTWEQVASMARQGMEIGSHTHNHQILARLPAAEAARELSESRKTIEGHTGTPCRFFCYPNGKYTLDGTNDTNRLVREAGYTAALYMEGGINTGKTDPYRINRHAAGMNTTHEGLLRILASGRPRIGQMLGRG